MELPLVFLVYSLLSIAALSDACNTGYYGTRCRYSCRAHCVNGYCTSAGCTHGCKVGYYKDRINVCNTCKRHCISCTSYSRCTECEKGYYGTSCRYSCKTHCIDEQCTKDEGCTKGCKVGYYKDRINVCNTCKRHCIGCTSYSRCTECEKGYYGTSCRYSCKTHCIDEQCTKDEGCTKGCKVGYYKDRINVCNTCKRHCISCTSYSRCSECEKGYYGRSCRYSCKTHCIDEQCTKDEGCTKGCKVGYYKDRINVCNTCKRHCISCTSYSRCSECEKGYYGTSCRYSCKTHCLDEQCTKDEGCTKGCKVGYYKDRINVCNSCRRHCISCTSYSRCGVCEKGYYGTSCYYSCKDHCIGGVCTKYGGCTKGCKDGYYKTSSNVCRKCYRKCKTCTSYSRCSTCKNGYYGVRCYYSCKDHCIDGKCGKDGCILGCRDGYYKHSSNVCRKCRSTCKTCSTRTTCDTCKSNKYGQYCSKTCVKACIYGGCDVATGRCAETCAVGQYLDENKQCHKCSSSCNACIGSSTNCTQCRNGMIPTGGACSCASGPQPLVSRDTPSDSTSITGKGVWVVVGIAVMVFAINNTAWFLYCSLRRHIRNEARTARAAVDDVPNTDGNHEQSYINETYSGNADQQDGAKQQTEAESTTVDQH